MPGGFHPRGLAAAAATLLLAWAVLASAQVQVRTEALRRAPLVEVLPLTGSVRSPRESAVAAQESGLVDAVHVEPGDRVAKGDPLVSLDAEMARLELRRLQAELTETDVLRDDAARLVDEGRRLVEDRNLPRTEYESRRAGHAALEARREQIAAEIATQRLRVARHEIRAPFAGVIGARWTEAGAWLQAGAAAVQLAQLDPLRIEARVPERYFPEVRAGTPVTVTVDAWPGQTIESAVGRMVAVSDADVRSFTAWMDVPNPDGRLAPGMSAHLAFHLQDENARQVLQVPADAVVRRADGSAVIWVVRDGTAQSLPVTVGRRSGGRVEILGDGLAEGLDVVTMGNESLRPGQTVVAVGPSSSP